VCPPVAQSLNTKFAPEFKAPFRFFACAGIGNPGTFFRFTPGSGRASQSGGRAERPSLDGVRKHNMNLSQLSLFAPSALAPEGLEYCPEFVTPTEERTLIAHLAQLELEPFQFGAYEGTRRVASFGHAYDFSRQRLEAAAAPPSWIGPYISRVERSRFAGNGKIAQVLITHYRPGAGIGWHRDKKPFDLIFGLSLGATCPLRFRRKIGSRWERFTLPVEPCSLYVISGEARSLWEHSIAPITEARYSITFRTLA
jgi:alkylated DNA repair dioxygenase AlkB